MSYSSQEQIAHVLRRLGMGAHPDLVVAISSPDEAIGAALEVSATKPAPPPLDTPGDLEEAREQPITEQAAWWVGRMAAGTNLIEERLVWFWMDHFATSRRKVPANYLLWQQHLAIREHAMGSFADLLHAMAADPAMLFYLDGISNERDNPNENFAREVMELYSLGVGNYTQTDIEEAARAFAGWVVNVPGTRYTRRVGEFGIDPWRSGPVDFRIDAGTKTIFDSSANHDMASTIDLLLEHPATAEHISSKMFRELAGIAPSPEIVDELAGLFREEYQVLPLVEAIAGHPAFLSAEAVRSKVRSPLEKAMTLVQAFPEEQEPERVRGILGMTSYIPFLPPNPAGYPKGGALLGPYQLTHTLDLMWLVPRRLEAFTTSEALERLGVYDADPSTVTVVDQFEAPHSKLASVLASPEFILT